MKIGFMELVLVFVVALLVIGPDKLPGFAQKLGAALKEFRKASADVTKDVRENVIEPLEDAQRPIREAMEPLEELDREVKQNFRDVERGLKNIGKPAPRKAEPGAEEAAGDATQPEGAEQAAQGDATQSASPEPAAQGDDAPAQAEPQEISEETEASTGGDSL